MQVLARAKLIHERALCIEVEDDALLFRVKIQMAVGPRVQRDQRAFLGRGLQSDTRARLRLEVHRQDRVLFGLVGVEHARAGAFLQVQRGDAGGFLVFHLGCFGLPRDQGAAAAVGEVVAAVRIHDGLGRAHARGHADFARGLAVGLIADQPEFLLALIEHQQPAAGRPANMQRRLELALAELEDAGVFFRAYMPAEQRQREQVQDGQVYAHGGCSPGKAALVS
ncbi:MAG: hypothetical protein HY291_09950 [Planctomycetes bacterium]|nr:hypothetical protein [Planctomycetota bacterium]